MSFDKERFKRLFHYVVWKAGKRDGFGATRLYKVLWFSEARTYVLTGKPLAGASYIREKYGPVPREAVPISKELVREGAIKAWKDNYGDHDTWYFAALRLPDTSRFSETERRTVVDCINCIDDEHTAKSISDKTYEHAWEIAKVGEDLPFYAILVEWLREPTDEELQLAKELATRLGPLEQPGVTEAVEGADSKWKRASDAWNAVTWVIAHDPTAGKAVTANGKTRLLILDGARSIDMPTVKVTYDIGNPEIIT
jgi:hypothetical protein